MDYYLHRECQNLHKKFNKNLVHVQVSEGLKLFKNYPIIFKEKLDEISPKDYDDSFHMALRPIATFVQFLFIMPVCGVTSDKSEDLKFKWMSFRVILVLIYFCYGVFVTVVYFKHIYINGINIGSSSENIIYNHFYVGNFLILAVVGLIFFSYTATCTIIFLNIARNWPQIMSMWSEIDKKFTKTPYKAYNWKLSTKLGVTAITLITLAFLEHFLFLANCIYNQYADAKIKNIKVDDPVSYFFNNQFGFLYTHLPFSIPMAFFNEIMNITFTFGWNYMELFVMLISLGLSTRFQQINERINKFCGKVIIFSAKIIFIFAPCSTR